MEIGGAHEGRGPEWALPDPSEPRQPPGEGDVNSGLPSQTTEEQGGRFLPPEYPTPEQRIVEADKRHRKRLAALARDHIIKLREERQRMAYGWLEEYSM